MWVIVCPNFCPAATCLCHIATVAVHGSAAGVFLVAHRAVCHAGQHRGCGREQEHDSDDAGQALHNAFSITVRCDRDVFSKQMKRVVGWDVAYVEKRVSPLRALRFGRNDDFFGTTGYFVASVATFLDDGLLRCFSDDLFGMASYFVFFTGDFLGTAGYFVCSVTRWISPTMPEGMGWTLSRSCIWKRSPYFSMRGL